MTMIWRRRGPAELPHSASDDSRHRAGRGGQLIFTFDSYELDLDRYELRRAGQAVPIEPQVFDLLAVLLRERARVVPKEELLDTVWGSRYVSESALTSRVKAARRLIGDDGRAQRLIRTVHGRGYQFVGGVSETVNPRPEPDTGTFRPPVQQIRFCTSADGTRLAYAMTGSGPPLVKAAQWLSHLEYDWESPVWRHWLEELTSRFTLLRYDERGCGLSDWDVGSLSFDDWVDDLETVVDASGLDRFPLLGISQGGPVAMAYAVRHPERVSHLVLAGPYAQGWRRHLRNPESRALAQALMEVIRFSWGQPQPTYRQLFAARYLPEATQQQWRDFDELQRRSTSAENAWRFLNVFADIDVTELAAQVSVPTLILCARREPEDMFGHSRKLATLVPDSRLVALDSANHLLPAQDPAWRHFLTECDNFLRTGAASASAPVSAPVRSG